MAECGRGDKHLVLVLACRQAAAALQPCGASGLAVHVSKVLYSDVPLLLLIQQYIYILGMYISRV